jgi:predicted Zn-dependent protease
MVRRGWCLLFPVSILLGLAACSTNPTTGRTQFDVLSRDDEIKMGLQATPAMVKQYGGEVKSADARVYVSNLGRRLSGVTEADNPSLPWEFTLLDSDVINAFALPGGKVFISRGLAVRLTNEAQMAGVLGHEIGHVTARHINDKIARQTGASIILGGLGAAVGGSGGDAVTALGGQIGQIALLSYDRGQESEADSLGIRYMTRLNYDPMGQLQVMEILKKEAGSGHTPEMLSTHPLPETRIQRIRKIIETDYKFTQNNPQYKLDDAAYRSGFLSKLALLEHQENLAAAGFGASLPASMNPYPYLPDWRLLHGAGICD